MVFDQLKEGDKFTRELLCVDMNERILVDPTSNIRSSQRLSHACLSTN